MEMIPKAELWPKYEHEDKNEQCDAAAKGTS